MPLFPDQEQKVPNHLDSYEINGTLGGGTQSTFRITDVATQHSYVLKLGAHLDALKMESLCNELYRTMNVLVPASKVYTSLPPALIHELGIGQKIAQVSEYIEEPETPYSRAELIEQVKQHFVLHALLGNIDVAKFNNFIGAHLIDAGANFIFRARGKKRKEDASKVTEIDSLRNEAINPQAYQWFADLNDEDIKAQLIELLKKQDDLEHTLWSVSAELRFPAQFRTELLQTFAERLDYLVMRFCPEARTGARIDRKATANTAAGVLTYANNNGSIYVLLGQRKRHRWWDNLGGMSDPADLNLCATACREVAEESGNKIQCTEDKLLNSPFHDLISERKGNPFLYRMYLVEHRLVETNKLIDNEHLKFVWIPLDSLIQALNKKNLINEEGEQTVSVRLPFSSIIIYPPLYLMLQQKPVRGHLRRLATGLPLVISHTQGSAAPKSSSYTTMRTLQSPVGVRQKINATLVQHASVIRSLKKSEKEAPLTEFSPQARLSQSEFHLKVLLGKQYLNDDLRGNVGQALQTKLPEGIIQNTYTALPDQQKQALIAQLTDFIELEKRHPERLYFYHACNEKIAFVYQVYTMLHRIIQADNNWAAFRGSNHFFIPFENIEQFIAHYSDKGRLNISHDAKDFHETALAANLFLFGNHARATSNSISYLLENHANRDVALDKLLKCVFRPMNISEKSISVLHQLYEQSVPAYGGGLYQISMLREQARAMSYTAGLAGKQAEYDSSLHPDYIIERLQMKMMQRHSLSDADRHYINTVQARLLVPPHNPLTSKVIRFNAVPAFKTQQFNKLLETEVEGIVRSILNHRNAFNSNKLHERTPIIHIQTQLYKANQVEQATEGSSELLVRAIMNHHEDEIKSILTNNPELKTSPLLYQPDYFSNGKRKAEQSALEMMIKQRAFSNELLSECFGEYWFLRVTLDARQMVRDILYLFSCDQRCEILKQLNRKDVDKLFHLNESSGYFFHLLGHLSPGTRLTYLRHWGIEPMKKAITSSIDWFNILVLIPTDDALLYIDDLGGDWIKTLVTDSISNIFIIPRPIYSRLIQVLEIPWIKERMSKEDGRRIFSNNSLSVYDLIDLFGIEWIKEQIESPGHLANLLYNLQEEETPHAVISLLSYEWVADLINTLDDYFTIKRACDANILLHRLWNLWSKNSLDLFTMIEEPTMANFAPFITYLHANKESKLHLLSAEVLTIVNSRGNTSLYEASRQDVKLFEILLTLIPRTELISVLETVNSGTGFIKDDRAPLITETVINRAITDGAINSIRLIIKHLDAEERLSFLLADGSEGCSILHSLIKRHSNESLIPTFMLIAANQRLLAVSQGLNDDLIPSISFFVASKEKKSREEKLIDLLNDRGLLPDMESSARKIK